VEHVKVAVATAENNMSFEPMDDRCPRKLCAMPDGFCPLAVLRLKALRNAGRELTEEEASRLPGCPWAVNHQLAGYCFFKYIAEFLPDKVPSEMEIAHFMNISPETVRRIEKQALEKIRNTPAFRELIEGHKGDPILGD